MSTIIPEILTPLEAADYLRIGRSSIYKLLRDGEIASVRIGRKIIVPQKALEIYLSGKLCYNGLDTTQETEPVQKGVRTI